MDDIIQKLIDEAKYWFGYLEKKSNSNLDDFTANAGYNNYTCFARDYLKFTGHNYQAQAWCAMYVSCMFVYTFGLDIAKKLLCGDLYSYCPTGTNQFQKAYQWYDTPTAGDVIMFTNGTRAYHTGIVTDVKNGYVYTIEGNTSGESGVIANGGAVVKKRYLLTDSKILGYGRPDYTILIKSGFYTEEDGIRYYLGSYDHYVVNDWYLDDGKWYWFDGAGLMVTDTWYMYNGEWYYLGDDGVMVKGLQDINGKFFYMKEDGAMSTESVTLTPSDDGSLVYPGLANK